MSWNKMDYKNKIQDDIDDRMHLYVLDFIRSKKLISSEENIIISPKVFMINAVLKWCLKKTREKKMSEAQWDKHHKFIAQYIAGIVKLEWDEGKLNVIEIPNENKRKRAPRRKTPRK